MSKQAKQDNVWDYTVERVDLLTPDGEHSGFYGNRRTDTKEVLGVVSEHYNILQNRTMFEQADNVFDEMGMKKKNVQYITTRGGAQARAIYTFEDIGIKVAEKDDLILRLTVANSFDGTLGAMFEVGFLRLVCTNGLVAPAGRGATIQKKHTMAVANDFTEAKVKSAIDSFYHGAEHFREMQKTRIAQAVGVNMLGNLAARGKVSTKVAKGIAEIWDTPTYGQDTGRTAWSLYNAATEYLTHEVAPKRYELASRFTQVFANTLNRVSNGLDHDLFETPSEDYALLN